MANTEVAPFGFPDFAPTLLAKYGPALRLAEAHSHLVNEMVAALPKEMKVEQAVIYGLVRMATAGWVELLILVGNGAGLGALKIARGMFETSVVAEYLRQFPAEGKARENRKGFPSSEITLSRPEGPNTKAMAQTPNLIYGREDRA